MDSKKLEEMLIAGNDLQKEKAATMVQADPRLGSKRVIEIFKGLLKNRSWHVRRAAALALIACLGEAAEPLVKHLVQDRAFGVREDVSAVLDSLRKARR